MQKAREKMPLFRVLSGLSCSGVWHWRPRVFTAHVAGTNDPGSACEPWLSAVLAKGRTRTVLRKGDISCAYVSGTVTYMMTFLRRGFV